MHAEALSPEYRERLYPPTVALSMFMRQALDAQRLVPEGGQWVGCAACGRRPAPVQHAHRRILPRTRSIAAVDGQRLGAGDRPAASSTGLPAMVLARPGGQAGRRHWHLDARHARENQRSYPQPSTQAKGVGFPLARVVVVICLAAGAAIDAATCAYSGKGNSELGLLRKLGAAFQPGDVMLADAFYCNYFLIATLAQAGVDVLLEQNGARITDFSRGESLGTRDHLVCWPKPAAR